MTVQQQAPSGALQPTIPPRFCDCSAVEVWHLQRVLGKKRDPLSHTLFLDVVAPGDDDLLPLDRFWWGTKGCRWRGLRLLPR